MDPIFISAGIGITAACVLAAIDIARTGQMHSLFVAVARFSVGFSVAYPIAYLVL